MAKTIGVYIGAPALVNLTYARRESVVMTITVYSDALKTTAYNLTGCEVYGSVRKADGTELLVALAPEIPTPANGQILVDALVEESAAAQAARWDILLVLLSGERVYIVKGQFKINPSITQLGDSEVLVPTGVDLQERVDLAYGGNGRITLPFGQSNITTTLLLDNKESLVIQGHGAYRDLPTAFRGSFSQIMANAAGFTDPMVKVRGTHTHWHDLGLSGDDRNNSIGGQPSAGFLIAYDAGLGAGKHTFNNVSVERVSAAFQCGEVYNDPACDTLSVSNSRVYNCRKLLLVKNSQCLATQIEHCYFASADTSAGRPVVFHYETGGDLTSNQNTILSKSDILRLSQLQTDGTYQTGHNAGLFRLNFGKEDTVAAGCSVLNVDQTAAGKDFMPVEVVAFQMLMSGAGADSYVTSGDMFAILGGGCTLVLDQCKITVDARNSIEWHTSDSTGGLTNLDIWGGRFISMTDLIELLRPSTSDGPLYFNFHGGSKGSGGIHLPAYSGVILGDL